MNELNERVQKIFCWLLKTDHIEWSVSIDRPVSQLQPVHGVIWQSMPTIREMKLKALIKPEFDIDGTNSLTRLQAMRVGSGQLTGWGYYRSTI